MIFETHAHYDDEAFDEDREELLSQMEENGIGRIVNVAADLASCQSTLQLCRDHSFIYGALGVHPSSTAELDEPKLARLKETILQNHVKTGGKVVAVGEIGLDYYWDEPEKALQQQWFERQLLLAEEVQLPVIIHSREAARDTCERMKAFHAEKMGGVVHCYSYSREMAAEFLKLGFYFGIGGVITFKNARKLQEVVEYLPMDRILLETDSPYLAPVPDRGKRNSSLKLPLVAARIAELKGISEDDVMAITARNAEALFGIADR